MIACGLHYSRGDIDVRVSIIIEQLSVACDKLKAAVSDKIIVPYN